MEDFLEIYSDDTNILFPATTCNLARLKFLRLIKLCPNMDYGEILIESAKDIKNTEEYENYLQWLSNPRKKQTASTMINDVSMKMLPEIFKQTGKTVIVNETTVKNIPNAKFIHIKNPKFYK